VLTDAGDMCEKFAATRTANPTEDLIVTRFARTHRYRQSEGRKLICRHDRLSCRKSVGTEED